MYIGVDIGGTKILVASADLEGKAVSQQKIPTPAKPDIGLEAIVDSVHAVARQNDIAGIGVAAPGPLDWQNGAIGDSPNLKWRGAKIVSTLEKHFKTKVILENDANTAALAEARLGAAAGAKCVQYVGIGTGIGTGLVINGEIHHGSHDTEGGHMVIKPGGELCGCGGHGHWETFVSGPAFKRRFGRMPAQVKETGVWDEYAKDVAHGLANLAASVSPDSIVIGGGVGTHFQKFVKPLEKHFKAFYKIYPSPKILPAKYRETASVYGAILLAKQRFSA
jgi:glucokinase